MNQKLLTLSELSRILTNHEAPYYNDNGEVFRFENILIDERIELSGIVKNIAFGKNCSFNKPLVFKNLNIETVSFASGCIFNDTLEIYLSKSIISLSISDCIFKKNVVISYIETKYLAIENSIFQDELSFKEITVTSDSVIDNSIFETSLNFKNCNFERSLHIGKSAFTKPENKQLRIKKLLLIGFDNFKIGNSNSETQIEEIYLENGLSKDGNTSITNIRTSLLSILQFENHGRLLINKLIPIADKTIIHISSSDLGYTIIQNCDFSKNSVSIQSSLIKNVHFNNIQLPNPENINFGEETIDNLNLITIATDLKRIFENSGDFSNSTKFHLRELKLKEDNIKDDNFKEKKDIYSQLKKMYEQRGDSVKSLEYQAKELEAYRKDLQFGWNNVPEIINLWVNRWTNNYGTS